MPKSTQPVVHVDPNRKERPPSVEMSIMTTLFTLSKNFSRLRDRLEDFETRLRHLERAS